MRGLPIWRRPLCKATSTFFYPPLEGEGRRALASRGGVNLNFRRASVRFAIHPLPLIIANAMMSDLPPPGGGEEGAWQIHVGQFAAKQYNSPSPPVERRSAWLQPPSGPREG